MQKKDHSKHFSENSDYFDDPVYGLCNIKKALEDREKAMEDEYEAFGIMYITDGIAIESSFRL